VPETNLATVIVDMDIPGPVTSRHRYGHFVIVEAH